MAEIIDKTASKQKVLMVHNFYQIGGGEHTVFANEVKLLRDHGHEVIEYTRSNDELKESKIKLLLSPFSTIWSFKTYREVKKIIKEQEIDIVHCHNTFPLISPSVYYAARKCGVPVVQTIHNFRFLCPNGTFFCDGEICEKCREKNSFKDALKNRCYRNSKIQTLVVVAMLKIHRALGTYQKINYIFLTDFNKKKFSGLIDINGSNVFVKPNFVNEVKRASDRFSSSVTQSIESFVFAGRLEQNKGIELLLERWEKLPSNYKLYIFGDGTLKDYVKKHSVNGSNIVYEGFQPQVVIQQALSNAKALVFPSIWYEGFPMVIAESLAIGCPVLTTDIGNQADVIKESNGGITFQQNSEQSFIDAVHAIIKENKRFSENARHYYLSALSSGSNYEYLGAIYNTLKIHGGGYSEVDTKVFIFAGRLEQNKGIISLIDMWEKLPNEYELHIYGEGTFHSVVNEATSQRANIKYYGFQSHEVVFEDMRKATAVIMASECHETFGMAIPESFSKGVPVISTNIGNPALMIKESKAGATYEIGDFVSFKQAIENVIENRKNYSLNAFAYYRTRLWPENNYSSINRIYNTLKIHGGGGYSEVDEKYVFVFAGRLEEAKGISFLLDAWRYMPENYELRILGNGPCEEPVRDATSEHENIYYMGFQPHGVIMDELGKATAMLFPSRLYEGFPMTICESFAQGSPVVSTNVGNQASLIEDSKAGCLFEAGSRDGFVRAVEQVIENRNQYSEMARKYYEENLTPSGNYKRMIEIYESAGSLD